MADLENTNTSPRRKSFDEVIAGVQKRASQAHAAADQRAAETPRQIFLPGFNIGAMPNHLNRSSLIAPIARGRRKFHRETVMVTRADCLLEYTGEQLDEADGDIIMALVFFSRTQALGTTVPLNRAELLRKIGRATGNHDYQWLHRRMRALTTGTIYIEAKKQDGTARYNIGRAVAFHVLSGFEYNDETQAYSYTLDPRWVQMFGNREYSLIDWEKRMQMGRGQDMAKALQRLVATSCNPVQHYALDWLKEKMQYASPVRKFREALGVAVQELVRLEIVTKGCVERSTKGKEQLTLRLHPAD